MAKNNLDRKRLGQHFKELRTRLGYSLENLASITGVSAPTISRLENGHQITLKKLTFICQVLGISLEDLAGKSYIQISNKQFQANIKKKIEKLPLSSTTYKEINEEAKSFHGPSYLVKMAMEEGYLNEFREVHEIQQHIHYTSKITLLPSSITNALKRNPGIIYKASERNGYLKYKCKAAKKGTKKRP
ncbi:DNA-binding transcriptional regulator, XRE-family HTH domain [Arachidicoccus rhizosphaerae]|jgi:transcriptional regulator with XRE-family HTH domain|uniref:DNA-binding transcriptional regulator, XRE-family HTH domain n=1 Tax=Arachidicoccus rhizosphaerae TaxID=551991 RepID=A0A1H4AIU5_9BACT|nr:helix-turn-helix transcriptional regulator [Arachidicoccus rhizosphaerae]SEA35681.1 DNA-binding transcriptional regulator, XRE-family HTH domain [Arachidicoccus rhizosphaerae]